MVVQCINEACRASLRLPANAAAAGKPVSLRCPKCGTVSRVTPTTAAVTPVAPPVTPAAPVANPAPVPVRTVILNERPPVAPDAPIGWLVVHDENTAPQTFTLREGRNVVGRLSESKPADVMIATHDPYMSRHHSVIEVTRSPQGVYQYLISDCGSTNGTFINADPNRRLSSYDQIYLQDGDTIQMGRTKVVLKTGWSVVTPTQVGRVVAQRGYLQTIIV